MYMSFYEDLVTQTQMNFERYYGVYASGRTPYQLAEKKPLPYHEQIRRLVREIRDADCVVVGGASGLSAAGGGDFYYEDNASFRKYFGKFAEKYHFKGAFDGMFRQWDDRAAFWAYLATFLHTTQTAPVRQPYLDDKTVTAFRKAVAEAARKIEAEPDKYRALMVQKRLIPQPVAKDYKMVRFSLFGREDGLPPLPTAEDVKRVGQWMLQRGMIKKVPSYEEVIYVGK